MFLIVFTHNDQQRSKNKGYVFKMFFFYNFILLKGLGKHITLLLLLSLCVFLMPSQTYACSKAAAKTEKSSCSKTSDHQNHSCKDKNLKKCIHNEDCGVCKAGSCRCSTSCVNLLHVIIPIELRIKDLVARAKKQKFDFKRAYYSSGFLSIWLPPKIS